jgi:hypothetical protein
VYKTNASVGKTEIGNHARDKLKTVIPVTRGHSAAVIDQENQINVVSTGWISIVVLCNASQTFQSEKFVGKSRVG